MSHWGRPKGRAGGGTADATLTPIWESPLPCPRLMMLMCTHHWKLDPPVPNARTDRGVCLHCGEFRSWVKVEYHIRTALPSHRDFEDEFTHNAYRLFGR